MKNFEWLPGEVHEVEDEFPDNAWEVFRSLVPDGVYLRGLVAEPWGSYRWVDPDCPEQRTITFTDFCWVVEDRRWVWPVAEALGMDPENEAKVRAWCERHGARVEVKDRWVWVHLAEGYCNQYGIRRNQVVEGTWAGTYRQLTTNVYRRVGDD